VPRGIVVMLDALGVRGMWARSSPKEVAAQVATWGGIIDVFNDFAKRAEEVTDLVSRCRVYAFSDTVFITLEGRPLVNPAAPIAPTQPDLLKLLMIAGESVASVFYTALKAGFYFRGAITAGDFFEGSADLGAGTDEPTTAQPLLIGPAIDNAAEWYEQADWMGVLVAPNVTYSLDLLEAASGVDRRLFERYPVPMKPGREGGPKTRELWALAWPRTAAETEGGVSAARERVLLAFARQPIGITPMTKYEETLKFFNHCIAPRASAPSP
jgi:hypothetical protein